MKPVRPWSLVLAWVGALACTAEVGVVGVGLGQPDMDIECGETENDPCAGSCAVLPDGSYCGSSEAMAGYGGDPDDLLTCAGGLVVSLVMCAMGCLDAGPLVSDNCSSLENCGDEIVDAGEECDGDPCCLDCRLRPASDLCMEEAATELGCPWGTSSGEDLGSRARGRYCSGTGADCSGAFGEWGEWKTATDCRMDEQCSPTLASCDCVAGSAWQPGFAFDVDPEGTQYFQAMTQTISTAIRAELGESPVFGHLQIRACKIDANDPNFFGTIHMAVQEQGGEVLVSEVLDGLGAECTANAQLTGEESLVPGNSHTVSWRIVSPAETYNQWNFDCTAFNPLHVSGSCWFGNELGPLERTCAQP